MTQEAPKPVSDEIVNGVLNKLTPKTPEQVQADIAAGKWPFAISEDQMRADIAAAKVK